MLAGCRGAPCGLTAVDQKHAQDFRVLESLFIQSLHMYKKLFLVQVPQWGFQ